MSDRKVYICDRCGEEEDNRKGWRKVVKVFNKNDPDYSIKMRMSPVMLDICLACAEKISLPDRRWGDEPDKSWGEAK